jgi:hypothetical protein
MRKDALRCMAANGMPIDQLMLMTRHRQPDTLKDLSYGYQLTLEAKPTQVNASAALFEHTNSD